MALKDELKKAKSDAFAEVYEIQIANEFFFYTSYERDIIFQGNTYKAVALKRGEFTKQNKLSATRVSLDLGLTDPISRYVANFPPQLTTMTITKIFVPDDSLTMQLFKGRLIGVNFSTPGKASADFEAQVKLFRSKIPKMVHQASCNNQLYDKFCKLSKVDFRAVGVVTVSGNVLTSAAFGAFADDFFYMGHVETDFGDLRLITKHKGNDITLHSPFDTRVITGTTVEAFAGCDLSKETCRTKFDNFANFRGFPFIPSNNPVVFGA